MQANLDDVLRDPQVDAVIVATPPRTHHAIVKAALEAGKHVLVEKPLATTSADARRPGRTAATDGGLVLMPGHTFVYSPSVNKVRDLIREDVLGEVYFVTSSRMNLGKYQPDGVIWTSRRTTSRSCSTGWSSRSSRSRRRRAASSRPTSRRPRSSR